MVEHETECLPAAHPDHHFGEPRSEGRPGFDIELSDTVLNRPDPVSFLDHVHYVMEYRAVFGVNEAVVALASKVKWASTHRVVRS